MPEKKNNNNKNALTLWLEEFEVYCFTFSENGLEGSKW